MPIKYTTVNIDYNEEQDINAYLDRYGIDILYAITTWDTTIEEALDIMRDAYGNMPVNRWIKRHDIIKEVFNHA